MSQFDIFCNKLGEKYKNDYFSICDDEEYNKEKTLDDKHNSPQKYIQAASEQIYYYWLREKYSSLEHDRIVNFPKDVDIFYDGKPYNLRVEVKTPEMDKLSEKYDASVIKMKIDHRYDNLSPQESPSLKAFNEVRDDIKDQINQQHTEESGKSADIAKNDDLKIDTFLKSANEKMISPDDKTINALLICLDAQTLCEYANHILNSDCGLFSKDSYLKLDNYKNIEYIILSNCCDAHFDNKFNFNVWDAENYFNFVIPLRFEKTPVAEEKSNFIQQLFNGECEKFLKGKDTKYNPKDGSGILILQIMEFIATEHPCFIPNKDYRKY